jgi:hypothetical protein
MPKLKMTKAKFEKLSIGSETSTYAIDGEELLVSITRGNESTFINWGNDWVSEGVSYPNSELSFLPESPDILDVIYGDEPFPDHPSPGWLQAYELEQMSIQDAEQC